MNMNQADKALGMLSLSAKAGAVVSGAFSCENAVKSGKARLVLVAGDASDNTKKLFTDKCAYYNVPVRICSDSNMIGKRIGKQARMVAAITDQSLAEQIKYKLDGSKDMEV